jgi:hypothetical protein
MRQKTKNYQNQEPTDKKWVYLVQKTQAKNSHAWAPLKTL